MEEEMNFLMKEMYKHVNDRWARLIGFYIAI